MPAAWSRSEAGRGDSSKTAAVPATEAIHQPASRSGIIEAVPADTAGSTNARSAPIAPDAAFGSSAPAKRTTKVTGKVTRDARRTEEDTRVPITTRAVPVSARPRWATALSRRVPPKLDMTRVANPPKDANVAIWRLPMSWSVMAKRPGTTRTARSARRDASVDQTRDQAVRARG